MLSFKMASMLSLLLSSCLLYTVIDAFPEQGHQVLTLDNTHPIIYFMKSMYKGSQISVSVSCNGDKEKMANFSLEWIVRRSPCANEYISTNSLYAGYYLRAPKHSYSSKMPYASTQYIYDSFPKTCLSQDNFYLPFKNSSSPMTVVYETKENKPKTTQKPTPEEKQNAKTTASPTGSNKEARSKREATANENAGSKPPIAKETKLQTSTKAPSTSSKSPPLHDEIDHQPMIKVWEDGYYLFVMAFKTPGESSVVDKEVHVLPPGFKLEVTVRMFRDGSYISAVDKPLLIFYGVMGLVYIGFGIAWLIMLACNWRDLLRIQFWIGGVIFLGMLEKAVFFAEYESVNKTGQSVRGAIILAELVSCLKRSLARMLVIIVSLGFGIVKPRLGQTLHKVLLIGLVYMVLGSIEGCTRALASKSDQSRGNMLAAVPLAATDAVICWWIFSSLLQTTRTLRLRRNVVKLSLFRHFTNTLIFAVCASVAYMIWFLTQHRFKDCLTDWKELWVDDAFWHLLFSVILFIIMILWRPNANNQRYAFSPLLDAAEDDVDDDQVLNEAYEGMKMRTTKTQQKNGPTKSGNNDKKIEDDLKWVEENIPSSIADKVLPALDSDEEIMNTRFEVSKME